MKNNEIKEMTTEKRRNFLLWNVQWHANNVLRDVRDNNSNVMVSIKEYRQWYRVYRNVKLMLGETIHDSPRIDINLIQGDWESY